MKLGKSLEWPSRKRIGKACDHCRKRKIRCNGAEQCSACTDIELTCTYGGHTRHPDGAQITTTQTKRTKASECSDTPSAESPISTPSGTPFAPDFFTWREANSNIGSHDSAISMSFESVSPTSTCSSSQSYDRVILETIHAGLDQDPAQENDASLHRGGSSGIEVLRRMRSLCNLLVGPAGPQNSSYELVHALDQPFPRHLLVMYSVENLQLPSKSETSRLLVVAFSKALRFMPFIDRVFIEKKVEALYSTDHTCRLGADDRALVYALIALGKRYDSTLQPTASDSFMIGTSNGLAFFSVAQQLIRLPNGARSLSSIQTIMCLALYLISVSAKKMAHCYVSLASYEAYHLGLHRPASAQCLHRQSASHIWTYIGLKDLDVYIKASLGLPRILHTTELSIGPVDAAECGSTEELAAANARTHLFEILGDTLKSYHIEEDSLSISGTYSMPHEQIREFEDKVQEWEQVHHIVLRGTVGTCRSSTRRLLQYYSCWAKLTVYAPFIHYALLADSEVSTPVLATLIKATQVAVQTVELAGTLIEHGELEEANPHIIEALITAATMLLTVELSGSSWVLYGQVQRVSLNAWFLLRNLASQDNSAAQRCLKSLEPLYSSLTPSPAT